MKNAKGFSTVIRTLILVAAVGWGDQFALAGGPPFHRRHAPRFHHTQHHHPGHYGHHRGYRRAPRSEVYLHYETPVYIRSAPAAGHHEVRVERVQVSSGHYEERWIPELRERRRDDKGSEYDVIVRKGHYEKVWIPPRYEEREVRIWVPDPPPPPKAHISIGGRVLF